MPADRPNVVWLMTDQHCFRALGCAGHPDAETPTLDRLAGEGVRFTDAYCPSPVCGPCRASLFTGHYPQNSGVDGNGETFAPAMRGNLLPELLRDAGYDTALAGKLHFTPINADHGFAHRRLHDAPYDCYRAEEPWCSDYVRWLADEHFGDMHAPIDRANADETAFHDGDMRRFLLGSDWRTEAQHSNTWVTDRAVEYLREHRREPFFLFASYFGPHQPMLAPGRWGELYDPDEVTVPDELHNSFEDKPIARRGDRGGAAGHFSRYGWTEDQYREVIAAYLGQVSMIDHGIGRILDALDDLGVREDTVVAFTADHGDHMGQFGWFFKGTMYEHSVRIPLVVDDPAGASGVECDHVVNNLGLFETVLQRAGVDAPATSSRSLVPVVEEPGTDDWVDQTYSDIGHTEMAVDGDYKLLRGEGVDGDTAYELYDRTSRPYDADSLWEHPDHTDRQRELRSLLDDHATRVARGEPPA
ncbi:MAG: sulfatase [Halobacteriaceae archaeon]